MIWITNTKPEYIFIYKIHYNIYPNSRDWNSTDYVLWLQCHQTLNQITI